MLGIGFSEMVLIAGIALVVIGPEKFPDFAKLVIKTVRDLRGYVDDVKNEVAKEMTPIKKEMAALSKIDPERYIDSLTSGDSDVDDNPSINEEDKKVMAVADADTYGEDPYGWSGGEDNQYGVDKGAYPEETVGYGEDGPGSEGGEAEDGGTDSENTSETGGDSDAASEAVEGHTVPEEGDKSDGEQDSEPGDSSPFDALEDSRIEITDSGEPDAWTGR